MTYYLVTAQIQKTPYMGDTETFSDQRLVKADDAEEAERKYEKYWGTQTDEYSVYYYASGIRASNTIE